MKQEREITQWVQQYNKGTAELICPIDIQHSYLNWQTITEEMATGRAVDLLAHTGKCKGPALLLGSGPSLDEAIPLLHKWKGAICCSTSQASTCVYAGHSPEWIVQLDAQTQMDEFLVDKWGENTSLVMNPGISPDIIKNWKGGKIYYRQLDPSNPFYSQVLPIAYPFIKTELLVFSCTPAAQLGILRNLGYNPIFLVGLDMGFPGKRSRFTWWRYREIGGETNHGKWRPKHMKWAPDAASPMPDKADLILSRNGVLTERVHLFFKRSIFAVTVLETHRPEPPQILYASRGIFDEFPVVDFKEVVERQGEGYESLNRTAPETRAIAEQFLASQRMYVIDFLDKEENPTAVRFFETEDWRVTIPQYIGRLKAQKAPVEPLERFTARLEEIEARIIAEGGYIAQVRPLDPPTVIAVEAKEVTP